MCVRVRVAGVQYRQMCSRQAAVVTMCACARVAKMHIKQGLLQSNPKKSIIRTAREIAKNRAVAGRR